MNGLDLVMKNYYYYLLPQTMGSGDQLGGSLMPLQWRDDRNAYHSMMFVW